VSCRLRFGEGRIVVHRGDWAWVAGLAAVVLVFFTLRWRFIALPLFGDELGWYVSFPLQVYDSEHWLHMLLSGIVGSSPGMPVVLVVYWKLIGYSLIATKLLFFVLAAITVLITAAVGRKLGGIAVGLGAASLLALSPPFFFHTGFGTTEVFITILASSSLLAVVFNRPVAAIGLVATAALFKVSALLLAPSIAVWWLLRRWRQGPSRVREVAGALAVMLLPLCLAGSWALWQIFATPAAQRRLSTRGGFVGSELWYSWERLHNPHALLDYARWRSLQFFVCDYRYIASLIIVCAALLGLAACVRRKTISHARETATPAVTVVLCLQIGAFFAGHVLLGAWPLVRYLVPAFPAFSLLTALGIQRLTRAGTLPICVALSGLYLIAQSNGTDASAMIGLEDHAGYRDLAVAYQQAFRVGETRCPAAVFVANYPGQFMAVNPRFGYVQKFHRQEPLPATRSKLVGGRPVLIVAGSQQSLIPSWVGERDLGRRWRFGVADTEIELVEPANATCAPAR
jgi:hypothetical protein